MNSYIEEANPWGGVDSQGNLRGLTSTQIAVDDSGHIGTVEMSPSVAVGDLNGDGLADIVIADPKGFFWFFPNRGTKTQPKFTSGEIMPIWLGSPVLTEDEARALPDLQAQGRVLDHLVPRIELVDWAGEGKLGLVVGTYPGKLFYLHNTGSTTEPNFTTPRDLSELKPIATQTGGRLNCNYFSPYLCDWTGHGHWDLLRGDGTYSANSVFLYTNTGTNNDPVYSEENRVRIVPGLGREHLVPQIIDWNNKGKCDIISGEREGYVDLFLNVSQDPAKPSFDQGQHLKFGGQDKFGNFTTVTAAELSGQPKVPDILIANDSGRVLFAHNTGAPGKPNFATAPQPLKGVNPFPKVLVSNSWALGSWNVFAPYQLQGISEGAPFGVPYELLVVTNASKEPGFAPPPGVTWKNALKYEIMDAHPTYFKTSFYPNTNDDADKHAICSLQSIPLETEIHYDLTFWIKAEGVHDLSYKFHGGQAMHPDSPNDGDFNWISITNPVNADATWTQVKESVIWHSTTDKTDDTTGFWLDFNFYGEGTVYLSGVEVHKAM